jgi:hypothetical protein
LDVIITVIIMFGMMPMTIKITRVKTVNTIVQVHVPGIKARAVI